MGSPTKWRIKYVVMDGDCIIHAADTENEARECIETYKKYEMPKDRHGHEFKDGACIHCNQTHVYYSTTPQVDRLRCKGHKCPCDICKGG